MSVLTIQNKSKTPTQRNYTRRYRILLEYGVEAAGLCYRSREYIPFFGFCTCFVYSIEVYICVAYSVAVRVATVENTDSVTFCALFVSVPGSK